MQNVSRLIRISQPYQRWETLISIRVTKPVILPQKRAINPDLNQNAVGVVNIVTSDFNRRL